MTDQAILVTGAAGFIGFHVARQLLCRHLVYASSSSVYGANIRLPFAVKDRSRRSVSLRFFTIYGPWGRPDMAMFLFVNAMMAGQPIRLFNHGRMRRDFTYIDDMTRVVSKLIDRLPADNPAAANAPSRVYNVGKTWLRRSRMSRI